MDLSPPRGTSDFLPPRSERLLAVEAEAHRVAALYGYRYVETPGFEHTELFARTSGETSDVVSKEMYTFFDRGRRSITLRAEGTAPVVRAYLANRHDLPSPFKAYYVEPLYRYGRPQKGRLREYRSFGIEVLGAPEPDADVEVVTVGHHLLRSVGLSRPRLEINSIGDEVCRPAYRQELIEYLEANRERLRDEHRDRFRDNPLRVLDCRDEACRAVAAEAPRITDRLCDACRAHFEAVLEGVAAEGLEASVVPTLVRGLDYYTRTVFEFVHPDLSAQQGSVLSGGRYDGLAEVLGGPATPGVGFGSGLERILLALDGEGVVPEGPFGLAAFVVTIGEDAAASGRRLVRELRASGAAAAMSFGERPLGAQMKMADRSGARFALIVGEREAAEGTVTIRRLADGHQETVPATDVAAWVAAGGSA